MAQDNPLLYRNDLHVPRKDKREDASGKVHYRPLPPYVAEGHWTGDCCGPHLPTASARSRWNRQQALYDLGSRIGRKGIPGAKLLARAAEAFNIGRCAAPRRARRARPPLVQPNRLASC